MNTTGRKALVVSASLMISSALFFFSTALAQNQAAPAEGQSVTVQHYPRYYYGSDSREPAFTLLFSVRVDRAALDHKLFFEDEGGKAVPATLRDASPEEIGKTWGYYGPSGSVSPPANQFVTAVASRPLPVGKSWRLIVPAGLGGGKGPKLEQNLVINVGSIYPLEIREVVAANPYDQPRVLQIYSTKKLAASLAGRIGQFVMINPQPKGIAFELQGSLVTVKGAFDFGTDYRVLVKPGLLAEDGLELEKVFDKKVAFKPQEGFINLPAHELVQPLSGNKAFEVRAGNLRGLRVRVKSLGKDELIYAMRGYRIYDPETADEKKGQRYPEFEMVPGKTVYDKEYPLPGEIDHTEQIALKWPEVMGKDGAAALYLSVEGESLEHPQLESHRVGAQSLVQLTDLGVVWKQTRESALLYAFSLKTGKPVPGAEVQLVSDENDVLAKYATNQDGVATLPLEGQNQKTRWLVTKAGEDRYATHFDPNSRRAISTWDFDVRQPWWGEPRDRVRSCLFTDRGVYRPGDEVHLKALIRQADGNELRFPGKDAGISARLIVSDGQDREVVNRSVQFSGRGSLDQSFTLPAEVTGAYRIQLDFAQFLGKSTEYPDEDHVDRYAYHYISVAEYRPNTFEVKLSSKDSYRCGEPVEMKASANYLRGKALSQAHATWKGSFEATRFRPAGMDSYEFGSTEVDSKGNAAGDGVLDSNGEFRVPTDFVPRQGLEQPIDVVVSVDVTDVNQQTISESKHVIVHSSDFYLGVKSPDGWLNSGQPAVFELKSVFADGKDYKESLKGTLVVEREVVETVKVQGAGEVARHRNETRFEEKLRRDFTLTWTGKEEVVFQEPGSYRMSWAVPNPAGGTVKTVNRRYVFGNGDVYWAHRDGDAIELMPEAKSYRVGDTAKIMVRSPMLGTALITAERAGVYRTFKRELTSKNEVIEIPVTSQSAPNLFVSALVIRGSQDSTHQFRDTEYKLGYCELTVEEPSRHLQVEVGSAKREVKPGEPAEVKVRVRDWKGAPLRGEEVTLWAVDEGVLSLTGYQTPDPDADFHASYPLYVRTWHSLFKVLTENPEERQFGNKGLMIGGGGEGLESLRDRPRKDFRATAYWNGSLVTDEHGEINATFPAPDSLTRYRILAVAAAGVDRFGSGTGELVVSKPVIVEPALPAFANVGDHHVLQAVVHNTTNQPGDFEVTLKLDERASLWHPESKVLPVSLDGASGSVREWRQSLRLDAGSTRALPIPVAFAGEGESVMTWTIQEKNAAAQPRSDSVESKLNVGLPVPRLGEIHHFRLKGGDKLDLLASFEKNVLQGKGQLDVTISNSRLLEAEDALEYNLGYPYGCAEQTTSSTLPWIALQQFEQVFPSLHQEPGKRERVVKAGLERLLSMQTEGGGLSYWPGETEASLWASAYGGMALALAAKEKTVPLSEARLQALWKWLSEQLRGAEETKDAEELHHRCLALYTLALAGKPETSYHETYYQKRASLAPESKALLSLAILEGGTDQQKQLIPGMLAEKLAPASPQHAVTWYGPSHPVALRLMVAMRQNPAGAETEKLIETLIRLRQPHNGWGSTYSNSWPLLALAEVARREKAAPANAECNLQLAAEAKTLRLDKSFSSTSASFPFHRDLRKESLQLSAGTAGEVFAQVKLSVRPENLSVEPAKRGFSVKRTYSRLNLDGSLEARGDFEIGDLVVVRLELDSPKPEEVYLAVDDPLPSIFEAIDPAFTNRGKATLPVGTVKPLPVSYKELRQDRALFFCNDLDEKGAYQVEYVARVVSSGEVTAPPAKIEAMYEPQRYGMSATTRVRAALPGQGVKKVAAK